MVKIQLANGFLDVKEGTNFPLNFGVADVRDVSKRSGVFSKTITLVGSDNNHNLLNHYYDVNIVEGTFNINTLTECVVIQNGVPILDNGYIQLLAVNKIQREDSYEDDIEYEVLVKDSQADFFTRIDNGLLEDIDLSYLNHAFSASSILASFNNTISDGFVYVMPQVTTNEIPINEFKPAIYAKVYWDKIHEAAGFSYEWSALSNGNFDKLVIPYNGDENNIDLSDFIVLANKTSLTLNTTQPAGQNISFESLLTNYTETQDGQNLFNPTTGLYTVPFPVSAGQTITHRIKVDYNVVLNNGTGSTAWLVDMTSSPNNVGYRYTPYFLVENNGVGLNYFDIFTVYSQFGINKLEGSLGTGSTNLGGGTFEFNIPASNLVTADELQLRAGLAVASTTGFLNPTDVRWKDANSTGANDVVIGVDLIINSIEIEIVPSSNILFTGATINLNEYIPRQVKQKDFVKSICQMYNLFVEPDVNNPLKLIYKSRDEYYDSGAVKDWTNLLAKDREQVLQFLPELSAKKLTLSYKPDKDEPNVIYTDSTREIYGQAEYIFDNEYVKGEERKELIFSPTPMSLNGVNAVVPMLSGSAPKTNIRILQHNGALTCQSYDIVDYIQLTGFTGLPPTAIYTTFGELGVTTYPNVHHFDNPYNPNFDINFAVCDYYYYTGLNVTNNNLYNLYWRRTMNQINKGKMLSAYFYLREDDIKTLRLNDKIRIDNSWWNINRVIDYNANKEGLTKVELMSIDDELVLPRTRAIKSPSFNVIAQGIRGIRERFYTNNNVNLSEGSYVVKGIGNVVLEGLEGFSEGNYKVITENGFNGVGGSENFANTDLTFDGNRSHNTDGNYLEITTDNGAYNESYLYIDSNEIYLGAQNNYIYAYANALDFYSGGLQALRLDVDGGLNTNFGRIKAITSTGGALTLDETNHIVNVTANTFTINLPTAGIGAGREYVIKNSGTGLITVDADGAETIDGAATQTLNQYESITIVSDGTNWIIVNRL